MCGASLTTVQGGVQVGVGGLLGVSRWPLELRSPARMWLKCEHGGQGPDLFPLTGRNCPPVFLLLCVT